MATAWISVLPSFLSFARGIVPSGSCQVFSANLQCASFATTRSAGRRCVKVPTSRAVPQADGWPVSENGLLPGSAILPISRWML